MPTIVQFTHPGAEHGTDKGSTNHKSWNDRAHRRKFLSAKGKYISDGNLLESNLAFWGEWEPPSRVKSLTATTRFHPHYLHAPYLPAIIPTTSGLQNTDPCVFDGAFKYFVCKQIKLKSLAITALARLERGSIVLFGSTANANTKDAFFQLDTVFVVGDYIDYDTAKPQALKLGSFGRYRDYSFAKEYPTLKPYSRILRFYMGATFDNPVDEMYSFSPAIPFSEDLKTGFPRVALKYLPYISNNLNAAPKFTKANPVYTKEVWYDIRNKVGKEGLVEGVQFEY